MNIQGSQIKPSTKLGSGRVRRFTLPGGKLRITQITTFCPDIIGPGPTHLYLIEDEAMILVDTGLPTHLAKSFFYHWRFQPIPREIDVLPPDYSEQEFREALKVARHSVEDIDLLVISHGHPDHFLLGRPVVDQSSAKVSAHVLDTSMICNPWAFLSLWISGRHQSRAMGMPSAIPDHINLPVDKLVSEAFDPWSQGLFLKVDNVIMSDGPLELNGSPMKQIEVRHLPGHSPGGIGLIVGEKGKERVLICGDILLYPITPIPDDLLVYLRTLRELKKLDNISLVLPAHGMAFRNLKARITQLQEHHRRRLRRTYHACRRPRTVWEVATIKNYFDVYVDPRKFNPLAGREALLHLELLQLAGGLHRSHIEDSVHYFVNAGKPFDKVYGRIMEMVNSDEVTPIMRY
jgi:glyoxylase-like metal-dependent hydrolase (beta-lactamase superfamily II)